MSASSFLAGVFHKSGSFNNLNLVLKSTWYGDPETPLFVSLSQALSRMLDPCWKICPKQSVDKNCPNVPPYPNICACSQAYLARSCWYFLYFLGSVKVSFSLFFNYCMTSPPLVLPTILYGSGSPRSFLLVLYAFLGLIFVYNWSRASDPPFCATGVSFFSP